MTTDLQDLLRQAEQALQNAGTEEDLRQVESRFLGKKGSITAQLARLGQIPAAERREFGKAINELKAAVEAAIARRAATLRGAALEADLARAIDVTLPGRRRRVGHFHPITRAMNDATQIFALLGFGVEEGPQVESDFHNFAALNMPPHHPARDMQDTFYISDDLLLRTHTSPVQIRTMLARKPPVRIIAPGVVYRRDNDPTHSPMFHQIEGLLVDARVSLADLKGVLLHFAHRFFGDDIGLRLRPSYFPFTEPSAELDIQCVFCRGGGCRTCKATGYLEIGGCGMVAPAVFEAVGYDPERVTGFAFGMGVERIAMLRYGISDIRHLYESDVRFLEQFPPLSG